MLLCEIAIDCMDFLGQLDCMLSYSTCVSDVFTSPRCGSDVGGDCYRGGRAQGQCFLPALQYLRLPNLELLDRMLLHPHNIARYIYHAGTHAAADYWIVWPVTNACYPRVVEKFT